MRLRSAASFVFALVAIINPAVATERACRPSLSNFYHCPDSKSPSTPPTASPSSRACHPSVSNFWTCPNNAPRKGQPPLEPVGRVYQMVIRCPGGPGFISCRPWSAGEGAGKTATTERGCRPSLSNGYKCPGGPSPSATPSKFSPVLH